jgi:hypothetical protein
MENRVIYKYKLSDTIEEDGKIGLPRGAQVLSVGVQDDSIFIWAVVSPDETMIEVRTFYVLMTGQTMPEDIDVHFLGTVHLYSGKIVLHVFEEVREDWSFLKDWD